MILVLSFIHSFQIYGEHLIKVYYNFNRKSRPKLTWMIFLQGSLCGLFG